MKKCFSLIFSVILCVLFLTSCKAKNTYKVVTDGKLSPFSYADSSGNVSGFEIDIINAVAKEQGINIEIYAVGYPNALNEVENGHADAAIAAIIPTDELMNKFDFSDMYYNNEYAIAVKKGKNEKLVELFNEGLSAINENGKYKEIFDIYFSED